METKLIFFPQKEKLKKITAVITNTWDKEDL